MATLTVRPEGTVSNAITFKHILACTDFSPASQAALRVAQMMAKRSDAMLYVLHAVPPEAYPLVPPDAVVTVHDYERQRSSEQMHTIGQLCDRVGIHHQEIVRYGFVGDVLRQVLAEQPIDLLVVGTHGSKGIEKLLLGSVAEEIFRWAECPVLTVGPRLGRKAQEVTKLNAVLFATDFSFHSEKALPFALSLAAQHHAELSVLHVVEKLGDPAPHNRSRVRDLYMPRLKKLIPASTAAHFFVRFGNAAEELLALTEDIEPDMIVMGVRKAEGASSHAPWAIASRVVRGATCPVLTVRS